MADRQGYVPNLIVPSYGMARRDLLVGTPAAGIALLTTDLTLNRTTALFRIPANFVLTGLSGRVTDLDTNGTPLIQFSLGIVGAAASVLAATTIGQTGGALPAVPFASIGTKFLTEVDLDMTVTAAAATAAAGTIVVFLSGFIE